jgi:Spy/CpxP family protein refolding chaperone
MIRSAIVITILAAGLTVSVAQPQRQATREHLRQGPQIAEELKLTEAQEAQWKELQFALQKKQTTARAKVDVARIELKELMAADKLDRAAIEKKTKEISDLQYQLKLAHIDHMFAVLKILTPEQQAEFKEHLSRPRPFMRDRMRQMMRGPRWGARDLEPVPEPEEE